MSGLSPKAEQALREADLGEIVPKLLLWTAKGIRRCSWRGTRGGPLPGGIEAEDLVQQAMTKLMTGKRQWDPEKVDLLRFLMGVIRSEIWSLARRKENISTRRIEDHVEGRQSTLKGSDIGAQIVLPSQWEGGFRADEDAKERERIFQLLKDDVQAARVAEYIVDDGIDKAGVLAKLLGIDIKEVYAIKKRLKRKLGVLCRRRHGD